MQTGKPEKVTFLKVEFTEEEFALLVQSVGDPEPGAEAQYIHDATMRSLRRKKGKRVEAGQ